jgi:hypothetical protein
MTSQLNAIVVTHQQIDRLAAAQRSRRAGAAAPRPRSERARHAWHLLRRRPIVA